MRDIILTRVPIILRTDIYAIAVFAGAVVMRGGAGRVIVLRPACHCRLAALGLAGAMTG